MADIATLGIRVDTSQVKTASRELDNLTRSGAKAEGATSELSRGFGQLRAAIAVAGIAVAIRQYSHLADTFSVMQSRLKLVTESSAQLADVQYQLLQIANRQRVPLEDTATLYARSAAAAKELGASQQDLLKFTEGVSAALTINGTSAQAASGALLQLSQAVGGNIIQAQEYNSLIDGARPLLQAVADNLDRAGGSVNTLTQLVKAGKVTSKEFFEAAVKGSDDLIKKVQEIAPTTSQAFTVLANNVLYYIGVVDDASDATGAFSRAIIDFANSDALRVPFETLGVLGVNIVYVFKQIGNEIGGIAAQLGALLSGDFGRFADIGRMMKEDAKRAREEVDRISAQILNRAPPASTGGGRRGTALGITPPVTTAPAASSRNQAALDMARAYEELLTSAVKLNQAQKSEAQVLQELLDSYGRIDPRVRNFVQTQIDAARANELVTIQADALAEELERIQEKVDNDEVHLYFKQLEQDAQSLIDATRTPLEEFAKQVQKIKELYTTGLIDPETTGRALQQAQDRFVEQNKKTTDTISEFWKQAARNMQDAMSDFFFDAMQGKLGNLEQSFKATIDRMVANLLASKLNGILFGKDFGETGVLGGVVGNIFGDIKGAIGFAEGGVPPLNRVSVVGEKGPELFVPKSAGTIIPNKNIGGNTYNLHMTVNTPDANSFRKSQEQIMADMQRQLNRGRRVV